jgi:S1-C subfamily serine protease
MAVQDNGFPLVVFPDDYNTYNAALKYADFDRDLCQWNVPGLKSPSVIRGTAKDLKVGAHVYAIGSPEGLELSLREGLVSGAAVEVQVVQQGNDPPPPFHCA